jgi:hypothetical protein
MIQPIGSQEDLARDEGRRRGITTLVDRDRSQEDLVGQAGETDGDVERLDAAGSRSPALNVTVLDDRGTLRGS